MAQFVFVVSDQSLNPQDKSKHLNVCLKAVALALKSFFQIVHMFANTKHTPTEMSKVMSYASQLQLSVNNLVKAVKTRSAVASQDQLVEAERQLVYYSQLHVSSVWNLHVACESISGELLIEEAKEYSSVMRTVLMVAVGKTTDFNLDDVCHLAMKECLRVSSSRLKKFVTI